MRLIPDDALTGLQRALVTAIWGLGTLLLGTLVIVIIDLLFQVSGHTSLGVWGGAGVVLLAGVVAFITWRRYGRGGHDRPRGGGWRDRRPVAVRPPPVPAKPAGTRTPPPSERATPPTPIDAAHGVAEAKRRFHTALEAGQLDRAEQIVAEIEAFPDEHQWCANARRRIQFARDRRR